MGCSPSSDKNPSVPPTEQERQNPKCSSSTKSLKYNEKSVYCQGVEMLHASEKDIDYYEDKRVSEMTVCKRGLADHWFIVLKVHMSVSQTIDFALHYYNNSTIVIKKYKEDKKDEKLTKTIYCPNRSTDLKAIIQLSLKIVKENSYNYAFHSCQTVVTKVMEAFTDRQVNRFYSKLKIPIKSNLSKPLSSSFRGSQLEKDFLDKYRTDSLTAALLELEQENDRVESTIKNLCGILISPQRELEEFKEKALDQNYDSKLLTQLKEMETSQTKMDRNKIICQFARSINLANTIWAIYSAAPLNNSNAAPDELLTPAEALEREAMENDRFLGAAI